MDPPLLANVSGSQRQQLGINMNNNNNNNNNNSSSGNGPYPSLPSSSPDSPNVPGGQIQAPISSIPSLVTSSTVDEASRETQRPLQQTTAALDAAYNRIHQVRRSLLELSESLPVTLSQLRPHSSGELAPGHDAISISPLPEPEILHVEERGVGGNVRGRVPWNQGSFGGPEDVDSFLAGYLMHSATGDAQQQHPSSVPNANSTVGFSIPRSFTGIRPSPSRRGAQTDDGSTLLGRRVAARLSFASTVSDAAAATNQLVGEVRQIYEGTINSIATVTRTYEGEIERALRALDERRRNSSAVLSQSTTRRTSSLAQTPSQVSSQGSPQQSSQATPQPSSQAPPNTSFTPRTGLGPGSISSDARQNSGPSERLSLLSNFSVQNFPGPSVSSMSTRPLIFDEPLSYVHTPDTDPTSESRDHHLTSEGVSQGRNYVVHRTYNRNGEELVHNITVDWDDGDSMLWLMPSPSLSRRRNRFSSTRQNAELSRSEEIPVVAPEPPQENTSEPPRRRGWARLDLDGNEIPSEEEEEVERIRTENRIRASQRTTALSSIANTVDVTTGALALPQRQSTIYQTTKHPVVLRHDPSLSYPADFVNPLPMPLSEMVDPGKNPPKRKPTLLPRHTVVAGR